MTAYYKKGEGITFSDVKAITLSCSCELPE